MPLGAHLTISKGLPDAADLTARIGGDLFGFHTRNPRGGARRDIGDEEVAVWSARREALGLHAPVGHLPYTVNLGSERDIRDFGVRVVAEDLARCDAFGAYAIVLHPGHAPDDGTPARLRRVADGVREALAQAGPRRTLLCLEAMAGQTSEIGGTPDEIGEIIHMAGDPEGLGICLDTCHLFAAGWDLRTHEGIDAMLAAFARAAGPRAVRALHLNDSLFPLGSHRDRHAKLGQGELGPAGMRAILTHPVLGVLPTVIETPVSLHLEYADEIRAARAFAGEAAVAEAPGEAGGGAPPDPAPARAGTRPARRRGATGVGAG